MAIINQALVDGAQALARAVDLGARQVSSATSTALSSTISSAIASATSAPSSSLASTITSTPASSTTGFPTLTSDTAAASSTSSNTNNNNNSGTSSPLLFFVALGFGVVFTNLWIIVGVKYCFRYNARNRQMRGLDENGEPINLENMPTRPHRRRREKKLMTMDEVNEKFPMMKYKTWVAGRAKEGLPTAGGVSAPASRANSVRSVEGIVPAVPSKEIQSTDGSAKPAEQSGSQSENRDGTSGSGADQGAALTQTPTAASVFTKDPDHTPGSDDEDDDQIDAAVPPELLGSSGDTCAICIDTLEDDDDIRGLTCGHAFHAVCLDPWLTNRRACCPLCKADYYTPKPRPTPAEGETITTATATAGDPARNNGRANMPRQPPRSLLARWTLSSETAGIIMGRPANASSISQSAQSNGRPSRGGDRRRQASSRRTVTQTPSNPSSMQAQPDEQQGGIFTRIRNRIPPLRRAGGAEEVAGTTSTANPTNTTPSQLEAGTRTSS